MAAALGWIAMAGLACNIKWQAGVQSATGGPAGAAPIGAAEEAEARTVPAPSEILSGDDWSGGRVAERLGGKRVAHGETKKQLEVSFQGSRDHCYGVVTSPSTDQKPSIEEEFDWRSSAGTTPLQRYRVHGKSETKVDGVCLLADSKLTASMRVQFNGTTPSLRYEVVEWKKPDLPLHQIRHMELRRPDLCDEEAWKSYWLEPIPGAIVYSGDEPVLLHYMADHSDIMTIEGKAARAAITALFDEPRGGKVKFPDGLGRERPQCDCRTRARSSFSGKITLAYAEFNNAPTSAEHQRLEKIIISLEKQRDDAIKKECKGSDGFPTKAQWQATLDAIVDGHTAKSAHLGFKRMAPTSR